MYIYICLHQTWKKGGIQRRKNVNNDARMKGKCPNILRNYESYEFLFWASFSSHLCVVIHVFASLDTDFFPGMIYIYIYI